MKQKCFQITTKQVRRSQQFQLRRQPLPCSRCSNRKGCVEIFAASFIEIPPLSEEIIASREIGVNRQRPNGPPQNNDAFRLLLRRRMRNQQPHQRTESCRGLRPVRCGVREHTPAESQQCIDYNILVDVSCRVPAKVRLNKLPPAVAAEFSLIVDYIAVISVTRYVCVTCRRKMWNNT